MVCTHMYLVVFVVSSRRPPPRVEEEQQEPRQLLRVCLSPDILRQHGGEHISRLVPYQGAQGLHGGQRGIQPAGVRTPRRKCRSTYRATVVLCKTATNFEFNLRVPPFNQLATLILPGFRLHQPNLAGKEQSKSTKVCCGVPWSHGDFLLVQMMNLIKMTNIFPITNSVASGPLLGATDQSAMSFPEFLFLASSKRESQIAYMLAYSEGQYVTFVIKRKEIHEWLLGAE